MKSHEAVENLAPWDEHVMIDRCAVEPGCICDPRWPEEACGEEWQRRFALEEAWSGFLSSVWCINLRERVDRFTESCSQLHAAGLCRLVRFHRPERASVADLVRINSPAHDTPGYFGCWRSHRAVAIRSLAERNLGAREGTSHMLTLVLEDDVRFEPSLMNPRTVIALGEYALRSAQSGDVDVLYLGHMAVGTGIPVEAIGEHLTVLKVRSALMHAYILTEAGTGRFLGEGLYGVGGQLCVDIWVKDNLRQRAIFPQLATQSGSASSNRNGLALMEPDLGQRLTQMDLYTSWNTTADIALCWLAPAGRYGAIPILICGLILCLAMRSFKPLLLAISDEFPRLRLVSKGSSTQNNLYCFPGRCHPLDSLVR